MNPLSLAWRNVWRNRRRSLVTMAAMSFALLMLIVYGTLVEGYLVGMERNIVDLEVGDVHVYALEYREGPSLYKRIDDPDAIIERLDAAGYPATVRALGSGLAAAGDNSAGVSLRGVDVERDRAVSKVYEQVRDGHWLEAGDDDGVVLGARLARILGASPGDELVLVSQAADGSMANDIYIVRGILGPIAEDVDRGGVYMTLPAFRELLVVPNGGHQLIVRRPEGQTLSQTADGVAAAAPELEVLTWRELMPVIASMFDNTKGAMVFMVIIIYTAIAILILNAMLMAVFERIREFGVLKALGVGPGSVLTIIMLETWVMTAVSIVVGLLLCIPTLWYLTVHGIDLSSSTTGMTIQGVSWDPHWRSVVSADAFTRPLVALAFMVTAATLYPAWRAARIQPVEAMRHR